MRSLLEGNDASALIVHYETILALLAWKKPFLCYSLVGKMLQIMDSVLDLSCSQFRLSLYAPYELRTHFGRGDIKILIEACKLRYILAGIEVEETTQTNILIK